MSDGDEARTHRARLAEIDRELARVRSQHDLAMSAFKFDEADALQRRIAALEVERRAVVAALPALLPAGEPPTGVVPVLARPARRPRVRRR